MSLCPLVRVAVGVTAPGYFKEPDGDVKAKLVGVDAYITCTVSDLPADGLGNVSELEPTFVVID